MLPAVGHFKQLTSLKWGRKKKFVDELVHKTEKRTGWFEPCSQICQIKSHKKYVLQAGFKIRLSEGKNVGKKKKKKLVD